MSSILCSIHAGLSATRHEGVPDGPYAQWVLTSFLVHSALFILLPASPWLPKKGESPPNWKSRRPYDRHGDSVAIRNGLVSSIHALTCIIVVGWWLTQYSFDWFDYQRNMQGGIATPGNVNGDGWWAFVTCNTLGYFLYDVVCMVIYHRYLGNFGAYVHHLCIGSALALGIAYGQGRAYHFVFLLEELSTPPLNFKNAYRHHPSAYKFWSLLFALSFFLCRGVFGLTASATTYYCIYSYYAAHKDSSFATPYWFAFLLHNALMFTISRTLNIYWLTLIAKKVRESVYAGGKGDKTKNASVAPTKQD